MLIAPISAANTMIGQSSCSAEEIPNENRLIGLGFGTVPWSTDQCGAYSVGLCLLRPNGWWIPPPLKVP
jgi:hypothetical protein